MRSRGEVAAGAFRLTHGDAELLSLVVSNEIDRSFSSNDIVFSDKEVTFNGNLVHDRTLGFAEVVRAIGSAPTKAQRV